MNTLNLELFNTIYFQLSQGNSLDFDAFDVTVLYFSSFICVKH